MGSAIDDGLRIAKRHVGRSWLRKMPADPWAALPVRWLILVVLLNPMESTRASWRAMEDAFKELPRRRRDSPRSSRYRALTRQFPFRLYGRPRPAAGRTRRQTAVAAMRPAAPGAYRGKVRRDKLLPEIDAEAAPFAPPRGWAWARFPELGEFGRGKSKHRPRNDPALFNPPIYPLVQTGEVARARGTILEYHSKYSELGLAQSRLWPAGTLCITIAANIADTAVLGFDARFPDSVVGFVPASCLGGTVYFQAFLETAKTDLVKFAPATAQKNTNLEILESLLVPLPPKRENERIVARVEELRQLCTDLRQRLGRTRTAQASLADALVDQALAHAPSP
ncbi:restriction endonuclease subunit S [Roseateles sp. NT4]|uniref:restriction endonuclease subunit S n=1 Tax=Roseateles sp. NT4 TaxID=3453715 RepID=UPI003EEAE59A